MSIKHLIGAHVSTAKGIYNAVEMISQMNGLSFALFLKNRNSWESKPYQPEDIEQFQANLERFGYDPRREILPHSSYLINLANPDNEKLDKAQAAFMDDLHRCEQLNIGLYNIHPGSTLGTEKPQAIKRIASGINAGHGETKFVKVVLENMTGQDRIVGSRLEDLRDIIELVEDKTRVGVCIDTCHTFSAGYDLRTEDAFEEFWALFDKLIGYKYLSGLHINDSKYPFNSKRDVHQNIGQGFLGLEPFRLIMNKKELAGIPLILETPGSEDKSGIRQEEIELLKWLVGKTKDDADYVEKAEELLKSGEAERKEYQGKHDKAVSNKTAKSKGTKRKRMEELD